LSFTSLQGCYYVRGRIRAIGGDGEQVLAVSLCAQLTPSKYVVCSTATTAGIIISISKLPFPNEEKRNEDRMPKE
jgi:hypothetical protein